MRSFGASLKAGGYKSVAFYFQAVMEHQQKTLKTPIPRIVELCIRDCIRSIQRDLGVSKLKDAFNGLLIGSIDPDDDGAAFSFENTSQCRGMAVIGLWCMLREAELAGAKAGDIVTLTIQLHKTDHTGQFTQRTLTCSCRVRTHTMCVC